MVLIPRRAWKESLVILRRALPLLLLFWCSLAGAQDDTSSRSSLRAAAEPSPEPREERQPMNLFAIGLKFGVAHVSSGSFDNPIYISGAETLPQDELTQYGLISGRGCDPVDRRCTTASRRGYYLAIPIQLGGTGVGFRVEPTVSWGDRFTSWGGYAGPTFEFHLAEPLYFGFGFGLKAAYVLPDDWRYAVDVFGRIPVWFTLYPSDNFALVVEGAFGAGASGYVSNLRSIYNPVDMTTVGERRDITFGWARTWDLSIGIRFP
jgi:hypothetical protein